MRWRKSIFVKLGVMFLLLGSMISILMGLLSYLTAKRVITQNVYRTHSDVLWQISRTMSTEIEKNLAIITSLYYDEELKNIMEKEEGSDYDKIKNHSTTIDIIRQIQNTQPLNNCNIVLFDTSGEVYSTGTLHKSIDSRWLSSQKYFTALEDSRSIIWEGGTKGVGENLTNRYVISAAKAVKNIYGEILFYIYAETDEKVFYDLYKGTLNLNNTICIVDQYGIIASSSDRGHLGERFADIYGTEAELLNSGLEKAVLLNEERYMVLKRQMAGTDWWIVDLVPLDQMSEEISGLRMMLGILLMIMLLLFSIFVFGLVGYFGKPIRRLEECMAKVTKGEFSVYMEYHRDDEIKILADGFNMMLEDLKIYMKDLIYQQQLLRNAELEVMQAQINPHFLYNTLESIIYLSQTGENAKIQTLVQALIGLLRMTVGNLKSTVSLGEEIDGVKQYISIQNIRYGNKIRNTIFVEAGTASCRIPKLLLQPLVENAIIHGIGAKNGVGMLMISVSREEKGICIEISDNGKGMNEEEVSHLMNDIKRKGNFSGIGVANVQKRIQAMYGKEYGLVYISEPEEGTTVEVHIPFVREERGEELNGSEEKNNDR